ncbi:Cap15 family cyclic dinucleotide receptor domain-containing protein [Oceanobacillus kimchii]|uniref:CD-NTase-associated protein 15 domain-containing protein n=1 Tax=Oceanobacillus kimchii TaxID=746691 RepID=A0ABQ5TK50_9BACI|nr:hypothetical protein [Oceanobacillus kimchii]GLO66101.1 hypothetical protein MACH08_18850 [Oceanobacillus kimchii]
MYNEKLYYRYLIILGILIFLIIFYIQGGELEISLFANVFSAAGITLIIDMFLLKFVFWKWCPDLFYKAKITNIPFLGGDWEGVLKSDFIYPDTGEKVPPIHAKMKIEHNFDSIIVNLETNQSYSNSYVAGIDVKGSQKFLCYLYGNEVDQNREINPKHDGATRLRIKNEGELRLEGYYWTGRSTSGYMDFKRKTKNSLK